MKLLLEVSVISFQFRFKWLRLIENSHPVSSVINAYSSCVIRLCKGPLSHFACLTRWAVEDFLSYWEPFVSLITLENMLEDNFMFYEYNLMESKTLRFTYLLQHDDIMKHIYIMHMKKYTHTFSKEKCVIYLLHCNDCNMTSEKKHAKLKYSVTVMVSSLEIFILGWNNYFSLPFSC